MESKTLACIDNEIVDEIVIGAMALMLENESCAISRRTPEDADDVTMAVFCDSDQQSAVVLRCTHTLAKNLTGRMLELTDEEIVQEDILDATGELVNVIAGNLRGLISNPGTMSAPFVLEKDVYAQFRTSSINSYTVIGEAMQVMRT